MILTEKIYNKYHSYSVEDLLQDDFFIYSMTAKSKETGYFWQKMIDENKIDEEVFYAANRFIEIFQVEPKPISLEEICILGGKIEDTIQKNALKTRSRVKLFYSMATSAAVILVAFLVLHNFYFSHTNKIENVVPYWKASNDMSDNIRLVLADNKTILLDDNESQIVYNKEGIYINSEKTVLKDDLINNKKQNTYNQLIVPFRKRSKLTLEDGSQLWINAGTRVVYPSFFDKNKRELYIDGEAFLDITPNKDRPFFIKTKKMDIEVLGTSFNIMTYEEDTLQQVVLVSGNLKIHSANNQDVILLPNQMYSNTTGCINVQSINVNNYISWVSGFYQFENDRLDIVMKRLSRYYGKKIECTPDISNLKCSGKLDMKDDIESTLSGIANTMRVQWKYRDGKYIINNYQN